MRKFSLANSKQFPPQIAEEQSRSYSKRYSIWKKGGAKILIKQAITYYTRGGNKRADLKDRKKFRREEEKKKLPLENGFNGGGWKERVALSGVWPLTVRRRLAPRVIPNYVCRAGCAEPSTRSNGWKGLPGLGHRKGCRDLQQNWLSPVRKREARVVNHRVATLDTRRYSLHDLSPRSFLIRASKPTKKETLNRSSNISTNSCKFFMSEIR